AVAADLSGGRAAGRAARRHDATHTERRASGLGADAATALAIGDARVADLRAERRRVVAGERSVVVAVVAQTGAAVGVRTAGVARGLALGVQRCARAARAHAGAALAVLIARLTIRRALVAGAFEIDARERAAIGTNRAVAIRRDARAWHARALRHELVAIAGAAAVATTGRIACGAGRGAVELASSLAIAAAARGGDN